MKGKQGRIHGYPSRVPMSTDKTTIQTFGYRAVVLKSPITAKIHNVTEKRTTDRPTDRQRDVESRARDLEYDR